MGMEELEYTHKKEILVLTSKVEKWTQAKKP